MADQSYNKIKPATNIAFNILLLVISFMAIFPLIFVFIISLTSNQSIMLNGYRLIPKEWSLEAYRFLWNEKSMILGGFFISVIVTVLGVLIGIFLTTTMGYVLSRPGFKLKKFFTYVVFIPMIFNGGMVASYVVIANVLNLKNTIWALILPIAVSSFNVIIAKTFFRTTIPDSVIESAKIDGANQFIIFFRMVLPISTPVIATISLFLSFGYWNDWFLSSLYISNPKLISLQALLNNIMKNLNYIANNPTAGLSLRQYMASMPQESVRMAIAVIIVIPIACAYPFFQRYFISGLTIGSVKG